MSEQKKLEKWEVHGLASASRHLSCCFLWENTEEGEEYWGDVIKKLSDKIKHGTSDGKPYVEPERWRVPTDEDAKGRPKCRVRDSVSNKWKEATLLYVSCFTDYPLPFCAVLPNGNASFFACCEILDTPAK